MYVAHQRSLMDAIPYSEFYLYEPPYRRWGYESRDLPENARFVPFYEKGKYDLAILHVDGECADPESKKGILYEKLNKIIKDIPKIVINHGTPWLPSRFDKYFKKIDDPEKKLQLGKDLCVKNMKKLIGDNQMVVNSYQAQKDWGWGTVIHHGMYGSEYEVYQDNPKDMNVVFNVSPAGWPYYYNRTVMEDIKSGLKDQGIDPRHLRVDTHLRNFDEYREYISRALIAVYVMRESPMPRSRTEHMLSGTCVLTTKRHDAEDLFKGLEFKKADGKFIRDEQGEIIPDGEIDDKQVVWVDVDNYKDTVEKVVWLYEHPDIAIQIGQNGKKGAQQYFTQQRYRDEWNQLLTEVGVL